VSEIRIWLDGIGLVQYAKAFESNDINVDLLREVDDQTLKDIGVSSAGHRLRIRSAITKFNAALSPSPRPNYRSERQGSAKGLNMLRQPPNGAKSR
jgi:SAM (Sterile alpha motif) domain-containing protein